ncbi:uncharacterized protein LOC127288954 [Leptopilina boulardi]|uniref:uncharacterized protein LOC127288954 n=1 Tax=Leptopilina boulardi TaxID=63433 RepID=UPI0021F5DA44|nr:uncharacterized protein LOC127288954 [Leptopilina boulardi]
MQLLQIFGITIFSYLIVSVQLNEFTKLRTHLNMTKSEFHVKCNAKNKDILIELKNHFNNFKETLYEHTRAAKMEIIKDKVNYGDDDLPENVIQTHCFQNQNITEELENMFNLAQTCLEPEECFNDLEKKNYLRMMTESTCSFMTFASVFPCRIGENNETVSYEAPIENCLKRYFRVHSGNYGEPSFFSLPFAKS